MDLRERLRLIAELLPDGASIQLGKDTLAAMTLAEASVVKDSIQPDQGIMPDLSIADIMQATGRARSTVHGWIKYDGLESYQFGNETRISRAAWDAFLNRRRNAPREKPSCAPSEASSGLGTWRKHMKKAG